MAADDGDEREAAERTELTKVAAAKELNTREAQARAQVASQKVDLSHDEGYVSCTAYRVFAEVIVNWPEYHSEEQKADLPALFHDKIVGSALSEYASIESNAERACQDLMSNSDALLNRQMQKFQSRTADLYRGVESGIINWMLTSYLPFQAFPYPK